jgi:hypothetical protein
MNASRPFEVTFLTSFSDTCFRAIPALAQMADSIDLRLSIVHCHDPRRRAADAAAARLRSFFPEADRYPGCQRRLLDGSPVEAVARLHAERPIDLLVAPAGDPLGMPRLAHHSLRATLLRGPVPALWTVGPESSPAIVGRPVRHVACCVHVGMPGDAHIKLASRYASELGAVLHIVQVLPEIHEGTLLRLAYAGPIDERSATERVHRLSPAAAATTIQIHVTTAYRLAHTLDTECTADLVVVDGQAWTRRRAFLRRLDPVLDRLRRPVICAGPAAESVEWQPRRRERRQTRSWPVLAVARRGTKADASLAG